MELHNDFDENKKRAKEYIDRILLGALLFERHGLGTKPMIFMSSDVMAAIARGSRDEIVNYKHDELSTVCGYEYRLVMGEGILHIGYSLL